MGGWLQRIWSCTLETLVARACTATMLSIINVVRALVFSEDNQDS